MLTQLRFNISATVAAINPLFIYREIEDLNAQPLKGLSRLKQVYSDGKIIYIYLPESQELMTLTEYHGRLSEWHDAMLLEELRLRDRFN